MRHVWVKKLPNGLVTKCNFPATTSVAGSFTEHANPLTSRKITLLRSLFSASLLPLLSLLRAREAACACDFFQRSQFSLLVCLGILQALARLSRIISPNFYVAAVVANAVAA